MNHQFKYPLSLSFLAAVTLTSAAHAELIVGEAQFNPGDVLPDPLVATSGDLLETSVALATGENAAANPRSGVTGTAFEQSDAAPAEVWRQAETVYELDLTSAPEGYDISEFRMFSGWRDDRAGQSYIVDYSLVGDDAWIELGTVSEPRSNGSLMTRTYDDAGALLASGVDAIRITQVDVVGDNAGSESVLREFDLIGEVTGAGSDLPEITDISFDRDASTVTLTWLSQPNASYDINYSLDLVDFDSELMGSVTIANDEITDDGDQITVTFDLDGELEGLPRLFFRIEN